MKKEQNYGSATKNINIIDKDPPAEFSIAEATNYTEELKDASTEVKQRYHFYGNREKARTSYGSDTLDPSTSDNENSGDIIYAEQAYQYAPSPTAVLPAGYYRLEGRVNDGTVRDRSWYFTYLGNSFEITAGVTLKGSTTDSASGIDKYYFSKDDGKTWEPENGQTGTSYPLKGLTGGVTYIFKMKAVDEAGNERLSNSLTKTLPFTAADIASRSDVGGFFGVKVTGHSCAANSSGIGWKMYYADYSNIYLIADDYIPSTYAPRTQNGYEIDINTNYCLSFGNVINDYAGSNAITDPRLKRLNSNYYKYLTDNNKTSTNTNIKAVAYLLDSSKWMPSFGSNKVEYAIGAQTLELLVKSYNQKYGTNFITRVTDTVGYTISSDGGSSYGEGFSIPNGNGLYWLSDTSKATWDWVASPSNRSDATSLYYIQQGGYSHVADNGYPTIGLRPVICLKSNIQLEKTGEGVYNIK